MDNDQNSKEIDLIGVSQKLGQKIVEAGKKLVEWFLFLVFFGIKKWKYFAIVGVAAIIFSLINYRTQSNQYEANMVVRCNAIDAIQGKKYIDAYSNLLGNGLLGDSIIEVRTGLDSLQRDLITSFSAFYCADNDKDGIADEIDRGGRYKSSDIEIDSLNLIVSVNFKDVSVLPALQSSVKEYFESVPYIVECNKSRLLRLNKRRDLLNEEIELLDTLQKRTYVGLDIENTYRAGRGYILVDNRKVIVYEDKIELLDLLDVTQTDIDLFSDPITIVEDFVIGQTAINAFSSIVKKNVLFVFVVTYLILFLIFIYNKEKDKYLKKFLK